MKTKTKGKNMQKYAYEHLTVDGDTIYSLTDSPTPTFPIFTNFWWCIGKDYSRSRGPFATQTQAYEDHKEYLRAKSLAVVAPIHPPKPALVSKNVIRVDFINKKRIS